MLVTLAGSYLVYVLLLLHAYMQIICRHAGLRLRDLQSTYMNVGRRTTANTDPNSFLAKIGEDVTLMTPDAHAPMRRRHSGAYLCNVLLLLHTDMQVLCRHAGLHLGNLQSTCMYVGRRTNANTNPTLIQH